ncbi:hypothetical protein ACVIIV_003225 [Bradyrhizobium sp. USDA 4354]
MTNMCGKHSIPDMGSSVGRQVLLVTSIDIVVWNAPDRQVQRMRVDLEGQKALNKDAIFYRLDRFGVSVAAHAATISATRITCRRRVASC